jgi:acyl-CoA thioester hydrolase
VTESQKAYRCTIEVRGYEIDSFGHVNNSVYLNYMEHARWKMLNEEGITLHQITQEKQWPVIQSIEIQYLKPSFSGDSLDITTRITEASRVRFQLEQVIHRGDSAIAKALVNSVVINEAGRPIELPSHYKRLWTNPS